MINFIWTRRHGFWSRLAALFWLGCLAHCSPAQAQTNYVVIYDGALHGDWQRQCWEGYPLPTDFAAAAPGLPGVTAIEVNFTNYWDGFGVADMKPGWDIQWNYLNEVRTVEFDIYFTADSTSPEHLNFILDDTALGEEPAVSSLIPGWDTLSNAQRYEHWHHVTVDLAALHTKIARFFRFILFNDGEFTPHFYLANIRLGWVNRATSPVIALTSTALNATYDQLTLTYQTDEYTVGQVEYGVGNYDHLIAGDQSNWSTNFAFTLTNLTFGSTVQYRITASDHRTDTNAAPNVAYYTGTFTVPLRPTQAPGITGFGATNILGNRATLVWDTERPCTAELSYHKTGGAALTRSFPNLATNHVCILDLLEATTLYQVTVTVTDAFGFTNTQSTTFTSGTNSAPSVIITVNTNSTRAISRWIYGMNFYHTIMQRTNPPLNLTLDRAGGNRWTAYNWENNASNAGNDWYYESDDYLGGGEVPAEAMRLAVAEGRATGAANLITVPMQGYVAADKSGMINLLDTNHVAAHFKQLVFKKGAAFTTTPSTNDAYVYADEFIWALGKAFTNDIFADTNQPTFVSLDNEPDLWNSTHLEIQGPNLPTPDDFLARSKALSRAVKDVAPTAKTFGPVNFGFYGIYNWCGAPGFSGEYWFVDKYLQDMKAASQADGRRLLDVFDIHWYSESTANGTRIGSFTGTNLNSKQIQAIVQDARSLWDTNYAEVSWIRDFFGGPIYILKRLQDKIDATWPGTGLAVTEYGFGGENHIAGAIAEADYLGVFGSMGVHSASYWPMQNSFPFIVAGFNMYRNYDGKLSTFGDVSLAASSSSVTNVAVYVSRDSQRPDRHVLVAINRSELAQDVGFSGIKASGVAKIYRVQDRQTTPVFVGSVPADLSSWVVTLPALSVSTIEITQDTSVRLDIQQAGGDVMLTWPAPAWDLREATNLHGPWVASPLAVEVTNNQSRVRTQAKDRKFFRLSSPQ